MMIHPNIHGYPPDAPYCDIFALSIPTDLAHADIDRFVDDSVRPTCNILSCIFSHTLGTPKNNVGWTSFKVVAIVPCNSYNDYYDYNYYDDDNDYYVMMMIVIMIIMITTIMMIVMM